MATHEADFDELGANEGPVSNIQARLVHCEPWSTTRPANVAWTEGESPAAQRHALEIWVRRGRDVLAVRHLAGRSKVRLGRSLDAIVPAALPDASQPTATIAECDGARFYVRAPKGSRLRVHRATGELHIGAGDDAVELRDGDRAVLMCGELRVTATVVPYDGCDVLAGRVRQQRTARFVAAFGAIAAAALALFAPSLSGDAGANASDASAVVAMR